MTASATVSTVGLDRYEWVKHLGRGAFGIAALYRDKEAKSGRSETLKVIKKIDLIQLQVTARKEARTEVEVLRRFSHPHIISYYAAFLDGHSLHIVMEFADAGDLATAIRQYREKKQRFSETDATVIFVQCLMALQHIHRMHVLHRDIKGQNIFLTQAGAVKLGDFGIAKVVENTACQAQTAIGTPNYLAPEVCENSPYGNKADIWSIGVVLYELLALQHPFQAQNIAALVIRIVSAQPPELPDDYSASVREIVNCTLQKKHDNRPSADTLLNSPVLKCCVGKKFYVWGNTHNAVHKHLRLELRKTNGSKLGLCLQYKDDDLDVLIESVTIGGLVDQWNKQNVTSQVKAGDHIVTVNDIKNSASLIADELKQKQVLSLVVRQDLALTDHEVVSGMNQKTAARSPLRHIGSIVAVGGGSQSRAASYARQDARASPRQLRRPPQRPNSGPPRPSSTAQSRRPSTAKQQDALAEKARAPSPHVAVHAWAQSPARLPYRPARLATAHNQIGHSSQAHDLSHASPCAKSVAPSYPARQPYLVKHKHCRAAGQDPPDDRRGYPCRVPSSQPSNAQGGSLKIKPPMKMAEKSVGRSLAVPPVKDAISDDRFAWATKYANVPLDMPLFAREEVESQNENLDELFKQISQLANESEVKCPKERCAQHLDSRGEQNHSEGLDMDDSWGGAMLCTATAIKAA